MQNQTVASARTPFVDALTKHIGHLLPAQAPLRDFVHHNTLHAWQHLPFAEALQQVHTLSGAWPWLAEETYQRLFTEGRINKDDLRAALQEKSARLPALSQAIDAPPETFFLCLLLKKIIPLSVSGLRWQQEIDENSRAQKALWEACCDALPAPSLTLPPEEKQNDPFAGLAHKHTWREVLLALTGEDIQPRIQASLVRFLAAHLDQGIAAWSHPERKNGLYASWKKSLSNDLSLLSDDDNDLGSYAATLPDDPEQCIRQLLHAYKLDESLFIPYLTRLALQLPGWAGMMYWRETHPLYSDAPTPTAAPVRLLDYLAIHLASEFRAVSRIINTCFSLRPRIDLLRWYFKEHPAEQKIRLRCFAGQLSEALAEQAQQLLLSESNQAEQDHPDWIALAKLIQQEEIEQKKQAHAGEVIWPLFCIVQALTIEPSTLRQFKPATAQEMLNAWHAFDAPLRAEIWLLAYERHYREQLLNALNQNYLRKLSDLQKTHAPPLAQLLFCMDEREEGFRRHLEEISPSIETLGTAGFFGVAMHWQGLNETRSSALCPVVVQPAHRVHEIPAEGEATLAERSARAREGRLNRRYLLLQKTRASTFASTLATLGGALPLLADLLGKTITPTRWGQWQSLWLSKREPSARSLANFQALPTALPGTPESPRIGFSDEEQIERVENLLRTIGLIEHFAPLVLIFGHGSSSRNNPHASAYDCGACSGRHGGPNARVLAAMANRPVVREQLRARGIALPDLNECYFIGAERNTGNEQITWYDLESLPAARQSDLQRLRAQLLTASQNHAQERCRRFNSAALNISPAQALQHVQERAQDFAQARPELGHCTNAAALIGRRRMSRGLFLDRRSFLISYDPTLDPEGITLEKILLAAGPVGAGISLEYYFSTVNNEQFGCNSKVTHNITGLNGVMQGSSSDLRTGLPQQMIEIHEPMRLLLICEAETHTLSAIIQRQVALADLFCKTWVQLIAHSPSNGAFFIFSANTPDEISHAWQPWVATGPSLPQSPRSHDWFNGQRGHLPPALIGQGPLNG